MIHLSLGTEREEYRPALEELCRQAFEQGTVIVAAARTPEDRVYPGAFDTVIGVCWDRSCGAERAIVYHPGKQVEFGAWGQPRSLPGLPEEMNFKGSSFAAARVTALAARMLEEHPQQGTEWVRQALKTMAEEENTHGERESWQQGKGQTDKGQEEGADSPGPSRGHCSVSSSSTRPLSCTSRTRSVSRATR